jgi:hypothetical protein
MHFASRAQIDAGRLRTVVIPLVTKIGSKQRLQHHYQRPFEEVQAFTATCRKSLATRETIRPAPDRPYKFFCSTPADPFFRPDRRFLAPSCRAAVKDGASSAPPKACPDGREHDGMLPRLGLGWKSSIADLQRTHARRIHRVPSSASRHPYSVRERELGIPPGSVPSPAHACPSIALHTSPSNCVIRLTVRLLAGRFRDLWPAAR